MNILWMHTLGSGKWCKGRSWRVEHTTEWNEKYHSLVLWFYSWSGENVMIIKEWNDLGLSLCTVPQSPVACIVAYFGVVEYHPKKSKFRSNRV